MTGPVLQPDSRVSGFVSLRCDARPTSGVAGTPPSAASVDSFRPSEVRGSTTQSELRRIATLQHVRTSHLAVDINKLKFGVEIEAEDFDMTKARPTISALPQWGNHEEFTGWKVEEDNSLRNGGEAVSPVMTMEGGEAKRQISAVVQQIKSLGGKFTPRCGLHVHVDASILGKQGLARLMRIALENENLMFRLSQNGGQRHRGTIEGMGMREGVPYAYCKPISGVVKDTFPLLHAISSGTFRNAYYTAIPNVGDVVHPHPAPRPELPPPEVDGPFKPDRRDPARYLGINFNSYWYRGTIEFRLFDPTDDPDQIVADVEMVLGLIKSAADDSYVFLQANPLNPKHPDAPVSKESFQYFLSQVAPRPELQHRLVRAFESSGGQLAEDKPLHDPTVLNIATLMAAGCRFKCADADMESPLEVAQEMRRGLRTVTCQTSEGGVQRLAREDEVEQLTGLELMRQAGAEKVARLRAALGAAVRQGACFAQVPSADGGGAVDLSNQTRLRTDAQVMLAMTRGTLAVAPTAALHEGVYVADIDQLERYSDLLCKPANQLPADVTALVASAERLQEAGAPLGRVSTIDGGFVPFTSRHAAIQAVRAGSATLPLAKDGGGGYFAVRSEQELQQVAAIVCGDAAQAPAALNSEVSLLSSMERAGVRFVSPAHDDSSKEDTLNRLGQLDRLRQGTLRARLPKTIPVGDVHLDYVSVPDANSLRTLAMYFN